MQYTTIEALSEKLSAHLQMGGMAQPFGPSPVSTVLMDQIAEQEESKVTGAIGVRYRVPLPVVPASIVGIVEDLIVIQIRLVTALDPELMKHLNTSYSDRWASLKELIAAGIPGANLRADLNVVQVAGTIGGKRRGGNTGWSV